MLRFFSKMRLKLAAENKVGRYLRYAVGEILLVVIGILIALQINNRNEVLKARKYEITMLTEIRNQLSSDLKWFDYLANIRLAETDSFNNVLLDLYLKKEPVQDSILQDISILNQGYLFQYSSGPYEALKSSGLDKISSDTIRNALANLYDFRLPWTESALEKVNEDWTKQRDYFYSLVERKPYYDQNQQINLHWNLKYENMWLKEDYEHLLVYTKSYVYMARFRITDAMDDMEYCLQLIDSELAKTSNKTNSIFNTNNN